MAKGSGFRTAIKIVKAIDRAQKQAARDAERRRKLEVKEDARRHRENEQMLRQQEKERASKIKAQIVAEKTRFKQGIERAKNSYEKRCVERQNLRNEFINQELR